MKLFKINPFIQFQFLIHLEKEKPKNNFASINLRNPSVKGANFWCTFKRFYS